MMGYGQIYYKRLWGTVNDNNGHNIGLTQGYYAGLFLRFLWFFTIYLLIENIILYLFGMNVVTSFIVPIVLSFLLNTSFPMRENYPFLRHALIYFGLLISLGYTYNHFIVNINKFYNPSPLWAWMLIVSVIFGVVAFFGSLMTGVQGKKIETWGNLLKFVLLVPVLIIFWWKGALVYVIARSFFLVFFERPMAVSFIGAFNHHPNEEHDRIDVTNETVD